MHSLRRQIAALLSGRRRADTSSHLKKWARASGDPFDTSPYFDQAEPMMQSQLNHIILPILDRHKETLDYTHVMDFAAGHGRNSEWLKERAGHILIVDINQSNIDYCKERFKRDQRFSYLKNDGVSLKGVESESITFLYSFDSMVHFDADVLRAYFKEFHRVLKPGGYGFCHHSNYSANPGGDFRESPHWRNFMSSELFAYGLIKEGLEVVEQQVIDWELPGLDCITLFRKSVRRTLFS